MNYIRHLNQVLESFMKDKRIIPRHISMYMALFFLWNKFKFPETIYFARSELMPLSKIGSMRYYHLTLHELDEWGYISYHPSKSMFKASCVTMKACYNSATSSVISTTISGASSTKTCTATRTTTSSDSSTGTSSATTSEAIKINTNKTVLNTVNSQKTIEKVSEHARDAHPTPTDYVPAEKRQRFKKPTLDELEVYFQSREGPVEEAQRFLNHFESNGWRVGGKSPMKDWKAAVRNWLLNGRKFQRNQVEQRENPLATSNDKDYGEPL